MSNTDTEKYLIEKLILLQERHLEALSHIQKDTAKEKDVAALNRLYELHIRDFETLIKIAESHGKDFSAFVEALSGDSKERERQFEKALSVLKARDETLRNTVWKVVSIIGSVQLAIAGLTAAIALMFK